MEKVVAWNRAARAVVRVTAVVCLWLAWVHFANVVAYRAPYGSWRREMDFGRPLGDLSLTFREVGLLLMLLAVSIGVVKLVETGARLPGGKGWRYLTAAVALVVLVSLAYVAAIDVMVDPS